MDSSCEQQWGQEQGWGEIESEGALITYFLGKSTKSVTAKMMMRSKIISLYISCPTWVSQHCKDGKRQWDLTPGRQSQVLRLLPTFFRPPDPTVSGLDPVGRTLPSPQSHRVEFLVVATELTGVVITGCNLGAQGEHQHTDGGQPHEDTPAGREGGGGKEEALAQAGPWELGPGSRKDAFLKSKPTRFLSGMMSKFWKQTGMMVRNVLNVTELYT